MVSLQDVKTAFVADVRKLKDSGMSGRCIARRLGIAETLVNYWLNGDRSPGHMTLRFLRPELNRLLQEKGLKK